MAAVVRLDLEQLAEQEQRLKPCLEIYGVRYLRSLWSADRKRMICEYEATEAEAVRELQREAGATFDTVYSADVLGLDVGDS